MRKVIAVLLALSFVFLLVSCSNSKKEEETTNTTVEDVAGNKDEVTEIVTEIITEVVTNDEGETEIVTEVVEVTSPEKTTADNSLTTSQNNTVSSDPSKWTNEQIVDFYKKACKKSSGVTSKQTMIMRKDSLKAEGVNSTFLSIAESIIRGVMKLNAIDVAGITGGHWDLSASDCKSVKAYKSGDYTVVEMKMKDQVDGVYGKTFEGTVGHGISVVNGVAEVAEQFSAFDVRYKEADIKIRYTEAVLRVKINKDGFVEKGTWTYVCTPEVDNLYIEGFVLNDAGAVIDYSVTLNGGF